VIAAPSNVADGVENPVRLRLGRLVSVNSHAACFPQKQPVVRQQFLKQAPGAAGAGIVAAQLFEQFLVPVDDPLAFLDLGLGREALLAFTRGLETTGGFRRSVSWRFSSLG